MPSVSLKLSSPEDWAQLRADIAFARQLRRLKVITTAGESPLQYSLGARNVVLDLRALTPTGAATVDQLPDPAGHAGEFLSTDGSTLIWAPGLDAETITWRDAILAAGGTVSSASISIANSLIRAIKATGYGAK